MTKIKGFILVIMLLTIFLPTKAQNSGERYAACTASGCAIIGNQFCGYASTHNDDGTVTTYWCVITVITAPRVEGA